MASEPLLPLRSCSSTQEIDLSRQHADCLFPITPMMLPHTCLYVMLWNSKRRAWLISWQDRKEGTRQKARRLNVDYVPGLFVAIFLTSQLCEVNTTLPICRNWTWEGYEHAPDQKMLSNVLSWKCSRTQENLDSVINILWMFALLSICTSVLLSIHWSF